MKYILAIPDGAADILRAYPDGNTPMRIAETPTLDELADHGEVGWAQTVPDGCPPGSDVACLSLFGYDPTRIYTGRAPLEAASLGLNLGDQAAFRCNLVTIENHCMKEFTAGHITTDEARELIQALNEKIGNPQVKFYTGVQYRHIMTAPADYGEVQCVPPHDILDKDIENYLPRGNSREVILGFMKKSQEIFEHHPINQNRQKQGKPKATQIWLWGQGKAPQLVSYRERCGLSGGVISAVDLIRGIGTLAGLDVIRVEGATGLPDTNYEGKADAALRVLENRDFVCIHVESTDEMGHKGDAAMKTQAIRDFDQRMLQRLVEGLRRRRVEFRLLVSPDHPTPISLRTHTPDPVPYILYDSRKPARQGQGGYSEISVQARTQKVVPGHRLIDLLCERTINS